MFRPNISSLWARLLTASRGIEAQSDIPARVRVFILLSISRGGGHTFTGAAQSVLDPKATKLINFSRKEQDLPVLRDKLGGYMASATS